MADLFIFGLGYSAERITAAIRAAGGSVRATGRSGDLSFGDAGAVRKALAAASHVLSSVPPDRETDGDPVLGTYGEDLARFTARGGWLGYLSSTGVYGDAGGAWVDETAPVGTGRRTARALCDLAWLERGARVFRLPGIYGPGRSALDRVAQGRASRIDMPAQVFSRVHVEDIASGVLAAITVQAPSGAYNFADDLPCSQNAVTEEACRILGVDPPPLQTLEEAGLSPAARGFYAENRRVANGKARRVLGWTPRYSTFRDGLRALAAQESR